MKHTTPERERPAPRRGTTSLYLDPPSRELLTEVASREERSQSQVLRRALRVYANQEGAPS